MGLRFRNIVVVVAMGAILYGGILAQEDPASGDPHRTGLIPHNADEIGQILTTWPRVEKVDLNWLGLERVNKVRTKKGKSRLAADLIKPVGQDVVTSVGASGAVLRTSGLGDEPLGDLPVFLDNSDLIYFPPVRSQGSLGSCASFATTYYQFSYMTALERGLDIRSTSDNTNKYSPKWSYNMLNGGADTGTSLYGNFMLMMNHGAATWAEFPYDTNYLAWCLSAAAWRNALSVRTLPAQYSYNVNTDAGLELVKELLNNGYLLTYGTYINSWQWKTILDDPSTSDDDAEVGKSVAYWMNGTVGGHAMTVVGYNDAIWTDVNSNGTIDAGEKGALRIANSWGTSWRDAGFCWLAYDALKNPSAVEGGPSTGRLAVIMDNAVYIMAARNNYAPLVTAEFTVNHLKRNQLGMTLGLSETSATTPATTWTPYALANRGGAYAFDGSTTSVDGTFVLDFTDIVNFTGSTRRFYVGMADNSGGDTATLSAFKITDMTTEPNTEVVSALVPQYADAAQAYSYVDHTYAGPLLNHPPVLTNGQVSPTSGTTADTYVFWTWYYDQDGNTPNVGNVYIDGMPHAMVRHSNYPAYNGWYYYQTSLALGTHAFYFQFDDGLGESARHPLAGAFSGPVVTPTHYVTTPNAPSGEARPLVGRAHAFASAGSSCNLGHSIQYRIDWGDGAVSAWLAVGQTSAQHAWSTSGLFGVRAQARCATETAIESAWSSTLTVNVTEQPNKVDFNKDGQEDILWRYYGTGDYQGLNVAWYMHQSGIAAPIPLAAGQAGAGLKSLMTGSTSSIPEAKARSFMLDKNAQIPEPKRIMQTLLDSGSPRLTAPKGAFKSVLMGGRAGSLRAKRVMNNPMDFNRKASPLKRAGKSDRVLIQPQDGLKSYAETEPGTTELAALQMNTEVILSQVADTSWEVAGTGDFDGDGDTDILWRYYGTAAHQGLNDIWFMDGASFVGESVFSQVQDTNWRIEGTGDFDGDGDLDILWRYYGTGDYQGLNVVWYMNGPAFASETVFSAVADTAWKVGGTGDFDGDGDVDILWRYYGTGAYQGLNVVWYMNGVQVVGETVFSQVHDTNWQIGGTGDFDGDGDLDILWRYCGTGAYQGLNDIWYLNGATFVSEEVFSLIPDINWRIVNR
jgi:C1A family cysteine protease